LAYEHDVQLLEVAANDAHEKYVDTLKNMELAAQQVHIKNTRPSMVNKLVWQFVIYTLDPATTIGHLNNLNNNITPAMTPVKAEQLLPVLMTFKRSYNMCQIYTSI
jgi:hypothetical protein